MIAALSTPHNRIWTFLLWASSGLLAVAAFSVGIDDNPPGILLAFLAISSFILAFVHPWRTTRQFIRLLYASAIGLVVFGLLQIAFDLLSTNLGGTGLVHDLLGIGAAISLIVLLFCPSGLLIGVVGAVVMAIRNRRRTKSGQTTAG